MNVCSQQQTQCQLTNKDDFSRPKVRREIRSTPSESSSISFVPIVVVAPLGEETSCTSVASLLPVIASRRYLNNDDDNNNKEEEGVDHREGEMSSLSNVAQHTCSNHHHHLQQQHNNHSIDYPYNNLVHRPFPSSFSSPFPLVHRSRSLDRRHAAGHALLLQSAVLAAIDDQQRLKKQQQQQQQTSSRISVFHSISSDSLTLVHLESPQQQQQQPTRFDREHDGKDVEIQASMTNSLAFLRSHPPVSIKKRVRMRSHEEDGAFEPAALSTASSLSPFVACSAPSKPPRVPKRSKSPPLALTRSSYQTDHSQMTTLDSDMDQAFDDDGNDNDNYNDIMAQLASSMVGGICLEPTNRAIGGTIDEEPFLLPSTSPRKQQQKQQQQLQPQPHSSSCDYMMTNNNSNIPVHETAQWQKRPLSRRVSRRVSYAASCASASLWSTGKGSATEGEPDDDDDDDELDCCCLAE